MPRVLSVILLAGCAERSFGTPDAPPDDPPSATSSPTVSPTPATPTPTTPPFVCDPADIPSGAPGVPGPVVCPFGPDAAALAQCAAGPSAALADGVGFSTIQAAIDATAAGGTIVVCPGLHGEALVLGDGKALVGADPSEDAVVLQRSLTVSDATLRGLTLSTEDVAPNVTATGDVVLECVTGHHVEARYVARHLGGGGSLTLRHSTFRDFHTHILFTDLGTPVVVEDSAVSGNHGPVVYATGSVTVRRSTFSRNDAGSANGGAILVQALAANGGDVAATVLVEDSLFDGNLAPDDYSGGAGGAIFTKGAIAVTLLGSTFRSNSATMGAAAVGVSGGDLVIRDSSFEENRNGDDSVVMGGSITLERVRFEDNLTEAAFEQQLVHGGAILSAENADGIVATQVTAHRNAGPDGAVLLAEDATFTCTCCDFGAGADDNVPVDLTQNGVPTDDLGTDSSF